MIDFQIKEYRDLTTDELYQALALRQAVFIVEQNCLYLDADGLDHLAFHVLGMRETSGSKRLVAYCRIVPPGKKYSEPSIGRVLTAGNVRRTGLGKQLMYKAIDFVESRYPSMGIRISAQEYLCRFYNDLGFEQVSDTYQEDGISHIEMFKRA